MRWRTYISSKEWAYNLLALLALTLPLSKRFIPPVIALSVLFAIYRAIRRPAGRTELIRRFHAGAPLVLLAAIYLLHIAGMAVSEHPAEGWKELEYKLSFLLFPVFFLFLPAISVESRRKLYDVFTLGCLIFLFFSVARGWWWSMESGKWVHLSYEKLGYIFHPTYMSAYQGLALFHLCMRGIRREYFFRHHVVHWVLGGLIIIYIAMLASKAGLIATGALLLLMVIVHFRKTMLLRRAALAGFGLLALLLIASWLIPVTSARISRASSDVAGAQAGERKEALSSTDLRKVTWSAAWQLVRSHPFGVGTGDVTSHLLSIYEDTGQDYAAKKKLNAHNQYLQTAAEIGWIGLSALIAYLIWFVWRMLRYGPSLALVFAALMAFHFLLESFLEVQAGIVFFCFWSVVFLQYRGPRTRE